MQKYVEAEPSHGLGSLAMHADGITVVSPHLDDAVLSCWHLLDGPDDVEVVNVFTGVPAAEAPDGRWDRETGASDSQSRMAQRLEEDRAALAMVDRRAVNLDLLDEQYRDSDQPVGGIVERLASAAAADRALYAPAALGTHRDHQLVRDAALALRDQGRTVHLYADFPHALRSGWPGWLNGASRSDADAVWEGRLAPAGIAPGSPSPAVHRLGAAACARKLAAVDAYVTQVQALERMCGPLDESSLGCEIVWTLPAGTR